MPPFGSIWAFKMNRSSQPEAIKAIKATCLRWGRLDLTHHFGSLILTKSVLIPASTAKTPEMNSTHIVQPRSDVNVYKRNSSWTGRGSLYPGSQSRFSWQLFQKNNFFNIYKVDFKTRNCFDISKIDIVLYQHYDYDSYRFKHELQISDLVSRLYMVMLCSTMRDLTEDRCDIGGAPGRQLSVSLIYKLGLMVDASNHIPWSW